MVANPPNCMDIRQANSEVELRLLPQKHQSLGKEHDHWFVWLHPAVKEKPSHVVRERNKQPAEGGLLPVDAE